MPAATAPTTRLVSTRRLGGLWGVAGCCVIHAVALGVEGLVDVREQRSRFLPYLLKEGLAVILVALVRVQGRSDSGMGVVHLVARGRVQLSGRSWPPPMRAATNMRVYGTHAART